MKRFRHVVTFVNLVIVASIAAGSFSMCLEDGTNAARAMACCKAHDNCPDSSMARECCKHERARDTVSQTGVAKLDPTTALPLRTAAVVPIALVAAATSIVTAIDAPLAAQSPPIFVIQHTFRI